MILYRIYRFVNRSIGTDTVFEIVDQMKRMVNEMETRYMDVLTQGVYLIGVKDSGKINFMTAAWITQISGNPKKILIAVGKNHYTAEMIRRAGIFSVNALAEGQEELARKCGYTSGRKTDKSEGVDYEMEDGVPVVYDTAGYLWCTLTGEIDEGDHVLFIGTVKSGAKMAKKPLVYCEKEYF